MDREEIKTNEIPRELECAYCIRDYRHGGECTNDRKKQGCLFFKLDPRGCIRRKDIKIPFKLYDDIPPLDTWIDDRWVMNENDTSIKIHGIKGLKWDTERGYLWVYADCSYYVNEFTDKEKEDKGKANLKVIK